MSIAVVYSRASCGIHAPLVSVEAHISPGIPKFSIVGLAETAVKESKDRVRSALLNCRFDFPICRITVNLAPADLPKEGGGQFDLAIALSILGASKQLPRHIFSGYEFGGELGLEGNLRAMRGVLPFALATAKAKRVLIIPKANAPLAVLVDDLKILAAENLLEVCAHLTEKSTLQPYVQYEELPYSTNLPDLTDVKGQPLARRALEIAAAGNHHLLLIGPPGTGKTMLANRLPGLLPEMTKEEAIETTVIDSLSGIFDKTNDWRNRRFRSPHHSASMPALVGGGSPPRPGEVSLAHNGVLFLDELPEFSRHSLEALREPLENGVITISRAGFQSEFPAKFQLIAAMNPCPCGYFGDAQNACRCPPELVRRYASRLSGPLLDRIDIKIRVVRLSISELLRSSDVGESSAIVRARVAKARHIQLQRFRKLNANLNSEESEQSCSISELDKKWIGNWVEKLNFSTRGYYRLLKVARTIADLQEDKTVSRHHLSEALSLRCHQFDSRDFI